MNGGAISTSPAGASSTDEAAASGPNPAPEWLTEKSWSDLVGLAMLPAFSGFAKHVADNLLHYKGLFDSNQVWG
jgi:dynein heavy chain